MPRQNFYKPDTKEGYRGVDGISAASLEVAIRDLMTDRKYAKRIFGELARDNLKMAMVLLAEAREAQEREPTGEQLFLMGALSVIAAEKRQAQAEQMHGLLSGISTNGAGGVAEGLQPAA